MEKNTLIQKSLLSVVCFIIIIAALKASVAIVVPFLLSIFIAFICHSPLSWLKKRGFNTHTAVTTIVAAVVGISFAIAGVVGKSIDSFTLALPGYQEKILQSTHNIIDYISIYDINVSLDFITAYLDPTFFMLLVSNTLTGFGGALTDFVLILFTVIFILSESSEFTKKIENIFINSNSTLENYKIFFENVNKYLAIKTVLSLLTATLVALLLLFFNVDYPLLWALIAFLFNYIPNIGSILAALPVLLLVSVTHTFIELTLILVGYIVINVSVGNIIEPKYMGRKLDLSSLVVFVSLIFWGWVLGPVGMLLSIPLTMIVKIAAENDNKTKWISILLGASNRP